MKKAPNIYLIFTALTIFLHFTLSWWKPLNKGQSIFYLDEQITTGMLLSVLGLFLTGVIYFINVEYQKSKKQKLISQAFGLLFWALMLDEYFEMHEYLNTLIKDLLGNTSKLGVLSHLSWVFPLSIILLFICGFILYSLKSETNKVAKKSLIIGLILALTVLPLEVIGGSTYGNWYYVIFVGLEEGIELVAISFFMKSALNKGKT